MKIISLAEIKTRIEREPDNTEFDTMLTQIIEGYSAIFSIYMNRPLLKTVRTEVSEGSGEELWLQAIPVDIKEPIVIYEQNRTDKQVLSADDGDYTIFPSTGQVLIREASMSRPAVHIVTYTGGFSADGDGVLNFAEDMDFGNALKQAMLAQVSTHWKRRDNLDATAISIEGSSQTIAAASNLLPEVKLVLEQFRRYI